MPGWHLYVNPPDQLRGRCGLLVSLLAKLVDASEETPNNIYLKARHMLLAFYLIHDAKSRIKLHIFCNTRDLLGRFKKMGDHGINAQIGTVQHNGIIRRLQRRNRTLRVTRVTGLDVID